MRYGASAEHRSFVRGRRLFGLIVLACLALASGLGPSPALAAPKEQSVRVVYLVPKDRERRQDYEEALATCARELQVWYYGQLGGKTFRLNDPIVEVVKASHEADWYDAHPPGNRAEQSLHTFYNALDDASALLGAKADDPKFTWLIYIDAKGGTGAGMPGVAVLPEHDLVGLIGKHKKEPSIPRWHGGAGHELGHAFNLPHPGDEFGQAIMQYGYVSYPACYFNANEQRTLKASPFLVEEPPLAFAGKEQPIVFYNGGYFLRTGDDRWEERKSGSNEVYRFVQKAGDDESIHLLDAGRGPGAWVALPRPGKGTAIRFKWEGEDWQRIYDARQ